MNTECSKHVEDSNKHIIEEIVRQVAHLPELYKDAGQKYINFLMQNKQDKFVPIFIEHHNNEERYMRASRSGDLHQTLLVSQNQRRYNGLNI
jgi:hypothetical protein